MKKTAIDYINILCMTIISALIALNIIVRFKNKEFSKIIWDAEICSANDGKEQTPNLIRITEALFFDNTNHQTRDINWEMSGEQTLFLSAGNRRSISFYNSDNKMLLPDSVSISYYSVDERKFYRLAKALPYKKLKSAAGKISGKPLILVKIFPKGRIAFAMEPENGDEAKTQPLFSLSAKPFAGTLDMVILSNDRIEKVNEFPGITNFEDLGDLRQNRYIWNLETDLPADGELEEAKAYSFTNNWIEIPESTAEKLPIPNQIFIRWKQQPNTEDASRNFNYVLNPKEVLDAFRSLSASGNPDEPIIIEIHIYDKKYPQCELTKGDRSIPLKDMYPDDYY